MVGTDARFGNRRWGSGKYTRRIRRL